MSDDRLKGDFCITIDFDKNSPNPERIFTTMSNIITTFKKIDDTLIKTIDSKIQPVLILEDVEIGSLKTWLKQSLSQVNDDALLNIDWKPLVGQYLVKAKYILIDFIDGKTSITDGKDIKALQGKLYELAENTGVNKFPSYGMLRVTDIIEHVDKINKSLSALSEQDKMYFDSPEDGRAAFNLEFSFAPEQIEDLLTRQSLTNTTEMILKVKKPDYLGASKWEFKYDNKTVDAKILDELWLKDFQARKKDVRPGDSIKASVKITVKYGYDSSVIATQYEILKIEDIIPNDDFNTDMFQ